MPWSVDLSSVCQSVNHIFDICMIAAMATTLKVYFYLLLNRKSDGVKTLNNIVQHSNKEI